MGTKVLTAIVYDIERGEVIANRDLNNIGCPVDTSEAAQILGWISISPLGNYILVNWKEAPQGGDSRYSIHKYDRHLNLLDKLANKGAHGDLA